MAAISVPGYGEPQIDNDFQFDLTWEIAGDERWVTTIFQDVEACLCRSGSQYLLRIRQYSDSPSGKIVLRATTRSGTPPLDWAMGIVTQWERENKDGYYNAMFSAFAERSREYAAYNL